MTGDDRASPSAAPSADARLAAGARVGRYEILSELGAGGMGVVYEARDPDLNRKVAVKLLRRADHGDARRLLREAQALAQLQHPAVVAIHDVGIADDGLFLAMELVDGENLALHLARQPTTWRRVLALYIQAGRGLEAAHAKAIIHRDVKPSNVLCDRAGRVRIGDFGLARLAATDAGSETRAPGRPRPPAATSDPAPAETVDADTPSIGGAGAGAATPGAGLLASPLTGAGALLGTPRYMAPEQRDRQPATARSDQYSFCVCLWEALYGAPPFADGHTTDAPPRRVPGRRVPGWLARALETGLAHAPERRHPSMTALLDVLERTPRRRRWLAAGTGATAVALAGAAALLLTRAAPADPCGAIGPLPAWDAAARDAVRAAFAASGATFAATTFTTVAARLDDHAARWRAMRLASCRATRVTGVQSAALLDARTACLDRRADEVAALVAVLRTADRDVVTRAADAVGALGDLGSCADAAGLARRTPLPADPVQAEAVRALEREVAALTAELDTGRVADRAPRVGDVVARARATHHAPLVVAALSLDHKLRVVAEQWADAERVGLEALHAAEAAGDDEARFRLMTSLVETVGFRLHKEADAVRLTRDAEALLARLGDEPMRTAPCAARSRSTAGRAASTAPRWPPPRPAPPSASARRPATTRCSPGPSTCRPSCSRRSTATPRRSPSRSGRWR